MRSSSFLIASLIGAACAVPVPQPYDVDWATVQYSYPPNLWGASSAAPEAPATTQPPAADQADEKWEPSVVNNAQNKLVAPTLSYDAPKASASSDSGSTGSIGGGGAGMAFSQYNNGGSCKTADELAKAIKAMSLYSMIRLYNTDCDLVNIALKNKASSQKLLVGIYDPTQWSSGVSLIKLAVAENGNNWGDIWGVTIGNEHVNDGKFTSSQMADFVSLAKGALGNGVKVAAVDVYSIIDNDGNAKDSDKGLCQGDFIAANAHPYFDGSSDPDNCGSWIDQQITKLSNYCGKGKTVLITETGWPTAGGDRASKDLQSKCISSMKKSQNINNIVLFSMWNEKWKTSELEQNWGLNGDDPNSY